MPATVETAPSPSGKRAVKRATPASATAKASPPRNVDAKPSLSIQMLKLTLVGDSPLIVHAWSHKAKGMILNKQMKMAQGAREAKDPERDYRESLYPHPSGGYGFPAVGFKSAAVDACSHVEGVTKVEARGAFHIVGDLVELGGDPPRMREDMVRVGMGTADIRYRGEFTRWWVNLTLRFNANVLSAAQIVDLFNTAGFAVGVGEWRPEKNGSMGMFHVATIEDMERIKDRRPA